MKLIRYRTVSQRQFDMQKVINVVDMEKCSGNGFVVIDGDKV